MPLESNAAIAQQATSQETDWDSILQQLEAFRQEFDGGEHTRNKAAFLKKYHELIEYIESISAFHEAIANLDKQTHQKYAAIFKKSAEIFGLTSGVLSGGWAALATEHAIPALVLSGIGASSMIAISLVFIAPLVAVGAYAAHKFREDTLKDERSAMFKQAREAIRAVALKEKLKQVDPSSSTPFEPSKNKYIPEKKNKIFNSALLAGAGMSSSLLALTVLTVGVTSAALGPIGWAAIGAGCLIAGLAYRFYTQNKLNQLARRQATANQLEIENDNLATHIGQLENAKKDTALKSYKQRAEAAEQKNLGLSRKAAAARPTLFPSATDNDSREEAKPKSPNQTQSSSTPLLMPA